MLMGSPAGHTARTVHAQSLQYWSDPVNISNSGSTSDPRIVADSDGVIHVVWVDAIDGYKYAESVDGKVWTPPVKANFPFSAKEDPRPDFYAGAKGSVYIVWRDKKNNLHVAESLAKNLSNSSYWRINSVIARLIVVTYDAVVDNRGVLHAQLCVDGRFHFPCRGLLCPSHPRRLFEGYKRLQIRILPRVRMPRLRMLA